MSGINAKSTNDTQTIKNIFSLFFNNDLLGSKDKLKDGKKIYRESKVNIKSTTNDKIVRVILTHDKLILIKSFKGDIRYYIYIIGGNKYNKVSTELLTTSPDLNKFGISKSINNVKFEILDTNTSYTVKELASVNYSFYVKQEFNGFIKIRRYRLVNYFTFKLIIEDLKVIEDTKDIEDIEDTEDTENIENTEDTNAESLIGDNEDDIIVSKNIDNKDVDTKVESKEVKDVNSIKYKDLFEFAGYSGMEALKMMVRKLN